MQLKCKPSEDVLWVQEEVFSPQSQRIHDDEHYLSQKKRCEKTSIDIVLFPSEVAMLF